MANRHVEDRPIRKLPRALAVVIQRLNVEGLPLPRALAQARGSCNTDNISEHCNDALGLCTQSPTGDVKQTQIVPAAGQRLQPGITNCSKRIISIPKRLITDSNLLTTVYKKPLSRGSSGGRKKIAVNGYKVKETVAASASIVLPTQTEPCRRGHDLQAGKQKSSIPVVAAVCSKSVRTSTKSVCLASPPITRQSFVANRVGKRRRKNSIENGWRLGRSKPLASLKTSNNKCKRVKSNKFIDDISDRVEKRVIQVRELNKKRKRVSTKTPPRKRRKIYSSGDETPPKASSGLEVKAVSDAEEWTCTSDEDDLAVSKKLEELQHQKNMSKKNSGLDTDVRLSDFQEGVPLTCLPPDKILYVYQPSDINTWSRDYVRKNDEDRTTEVVSSVTESGIGRHGVDNYFIPLDLGSTACIKHANLEIDPSAIIANGVDMSIWSWSIEDSVNAYQTRWRVLSTSERRKLWFGTTRPKPAPEKTVPTKKRVTKRTKSANRPTSRPRKQTADILPPKSSLRQKLKEKGDKTKPKLSKSSISKETRVRSKGRQKPAESCKDGPKRPRGRPKKLKDVPSKISIQVASESPPLGSPEDSGYPGSISSSSSQGHKTLKSPLDIDMVLDPTAITTVSMPILEQQWRGSVNTAELGLFSPEPDPTTIMNFPMPPDPTWDWSGVGIGQNDTHNNQLFLNSDLDQNSDSNRSLFDPSKMIIAKVESLSEDSQFNDYLNEILESEEVIECLNSINTTSTLSVLDPPQLLPTKQPNETTSVSNSEQAFEATPVAFLPTSISTTVTSDVPATTSEATLLPSVTVSQQSAESVAAYIAAETNLVPFTVQDCFTTTDVTGSLAKVSDPASLLSVVTQQDASGPCLVSSTMPTISQHCDELKPESIVMWSQNTVEIEPCLPEPVIKLPTQKPQQSTVSTSYDLQKIDDKQPPTKPKESSAAIDVKTCAAKKRIFRIRRSKKAVETTSNTDTSKAVESQSKKKVKGPSGTSTKTASIKSLHPPPHSSEPEVKSRNGRPIKPSWKVAESTSNRSLKRTISPITLQAKSPVKCTSTVTAAAQAKDTCTPKTIKLCRDRSKKSSLSLAAVVGSCLKTLPDIPATPCSPNPAVALPSSTSGALSMSLDDILRQMSEDDPQKMQALEFAESLLANVAPNDSKEDATTESVKDDVEKNKSTARRLKVIKPMTSSSAKKGSAELERNVDHSLIESKPLSTPQPQPASEKLSETSSIGDTVSSSVLSKQPLTSCTGPGDSSQHTRIMMMSDNAVLKDEEDCSQSSDDEYCRSVMMDLCDSDTSQKNMTKSPIANEIQEQQQSHEVDETTCHDNDGDDLGEEVAEDEIEIFADDVDTFTVYTMDDRNTPPRMPSPPRNTSPQLTITRKQSVDQPRSHNTRLCCSSSKLGQSKKENGSSGSIPPLFPPLTTSSGSIPPTFQSTAPLTASSLPPPHAPYPLSAPPFFSHHQQFHPPSTPHNNHNSTSTNIYHRLGQCSKPQPYLPPSEQCGTSLRLCWDFLRGRCKYKHCKYSHIPLESVTDTQFENMILRLPLETIPQDITVHRYVIKSSTKTKEWFSILIQLIRGLANNIWDASFRAYTKLLSDGIALSPSLHSRFLELCREQAQGQGTHTSSINFPRLVLDVLQTIKDNCGICSSDNYCTVLRILDFCNKPIVLMDVYVSMKDDGHVVNRDILHLVLRGCASTDERILQLLNDSKLFLYISNDIARIANGVLEKVSPQMLSRNGEIIESWISGINGILDIMGHDAILKLFNLFVSAQSWPSLLLLLEESPKAVIGLGSRLCQPLSMIVTHYPALSDRVLAILEMMSDECLYGITSEAWNAVLTQAALSGTPERISKFHRVLSHSNTCLDQEALNAILEVLITNSQSSTAMDIISVHFKFVPPVIPSMTVLGKLCELLLQNSQHQDLCTIVDKLLQCKVEPSLQILQSFVDSCSKEKTLNQLAAVVKKARHCGLHLEKIFYQRALVLLRPWGQDQVAISTIYKALRTIDTESPNVSLSQKGGVWNFPHGEVLGDSGRSTTGSMVSVITSSSQPSLSSRTSLEGIYLKTGDTSSTKPGIIGLLESNYKQGQFGAAVSILHNLQEDSSSSTYSGDVVLAMWKAITQSEQKPANAFSSLLEKLTQPPTDSTRSSLASCDHWLVAQIGIALLKMYTDTQHWQSGFVILHHLHRYKINYFARLKPFSHLPPLKPPLLSLLGLAKIAVNTCLKTENIELAVSVLKESEWISSCPVENLERVQLLITVSEKCLDSALYKQCNNCLQALSSLSTKSKHFTHVTKLYNRLFSSVLSTSSVDVDLSICIYQNMNNGNFPCLPKHFSVLLEKLCDLLQLSTARNYCEQAIDQTFYPPLTHGDVFSLHLPPSIHHIEVCSLIERHLHWMSDQLENTPLQTLVINFEEDNKSRVKHALTKSIAPSLSPVYTSGCATVIPLNLLGWFNKHYPNVDFVVDNQRASSSTAGAVATSSSITTTKRHTATKKDNTTASTSDTPMATTTASTTDPLRESTSDSVRDNPTTLNSNARSCKRIFVGKSISTPTTSAASDSESSSLAKSSLNVRKLKQQRKDFRVALCRLIVSEVKPFYEIEEKFASHDDYLHLLKMLTTYFCNSLKSKPSSSAGGYGNKWTMTDAIRSKVKDFVNSIMSQCTTYTPDLDIQLGL